MDEPVSLSAMLNARERRALYRREYFAGRGEGSCLLQITVNIPGSEKNSPMVRDIFDTSLEAVLKAFPEGKILPPTSRVLNTGPEAWMELSEPALFVKKKTGLLEERHAWGRLWDIDVFSGPDKCLSRGDAGLESRTCYLCGRPAHECARSRAHSTDELRAYIRDLYEINRPLPSSL